MSYEERINITMKIILHCMKHNAVSFNFWITSGVRNNCSLHVYIPDTWLWKHIIHFLRKTNINANRKLLPCTFKVSVAHILDIPKSFEKKCTSVFVEDMQILCNQYIMMLLIKTKTNSHVTLYTRYFQDMMWKEY